MDDPPPLFLVQIQAIPSKEPSTLIGGEQPGWDRRTGRTGGRDPDR
jgi:hypothetical protein